MIKETLMALCVATCACAHSLHQSTAEAEYNAETNKLEVSLTVFINDLELALIRHSELLMSLEKTPAADFDAQIQSYLAKTFMVTDAVGKAAKIEWVGRELDKETAKTGDPAVTLFFEARLAKGLTGAKLQNQLLCELFSDQSNLLHLSDGMHKRELKFGRGGPAQSLAADR